MVFVVSLEEAARVASSRVSAAEFGALVERARSDFGGLLDDGALALLVLDELGLNEGAFVALADLGGRSEASVRVSVVRVDGVREFAREGRPPGRVASCVVRDSSGEARLTLWDRDVERVEDGSLFVGASLRVANARVKEGRFGVELHASPWTALVVEGAPDAARRKLLADVSDSGDSLALGPLLVEDGVERALRPRPIDAPGPLRGVLLAVSPTRSFRRADGGVGFVCDVDVESSEGVVRVLCWDECVKVVRSFALGSGVAFEGLVARPKGAGVEWHTSRESRVRALSARESGGE